MITTNGVFKAIGDHGLRSVVLPLLGSGREKWNVTLFLWMVMANLPLCPALQYLRIISRGSQGWSERHHNAVKHFLKHANRMLSTCGSLQASDTTRLARCRDDRATAHFNNYLIALQDMHYKEPDDVILRNSGALRMFRELIQKAEIKRTRRPH